MPGRSGVPRRSRTLGRTSHPRGQPLRSGRRRSAWRNASATKPHLSANWSHAASYGVPVSEDALASMRRTLHGVAECILAGHQYRMTGSIRLRVTEGGFATHAMPAAPGLLAVADSCLIVRDGLEVQKLSLSGTFGEVAHQAGVEFGPPEGVYGQGSGCQPDETLTVDNDSFETIVAAFARGDRALRALAAKVSPEESGEPVLWPEHFDLGISLDEVNYGVSPGDATIPEPYAYVGPWTQRSGPFWDQPFGAARLISEMTDHTALLRFFTEGRERSVSDPARH